MAAPLPWPEPRHGRVTGARRADDGGAGGARSRRGTPREGTRWRVMLFDRVMRRRQVDRRSGRGRNGATMLGRYELVQPLGVGGMAQVFKARAMGPGGFRRDVVVKRILPQYGRDAEFIRMFVDEA